MSPSVSGKPTTQDRVDACPICERTDAWAPLPTDDSKHWFCKRCGEFHINGTAATLVQYLNVDQRHWIARQTRRSPMPLRVDEETIRLARAHVHQRRPLFEGVDEYLAYLADRAESAFVAIESRPELDFPLLDLSSEQEMRDAARTAQLLEYTDGETEGRTHLRVKGWARADELRRHQPRTRRAFMAMQFGGARLDRVFEAFKEGLRDTGYDLFKLDEVPRAGLIDDRLRVEIRRSRFLIADLTHGNQGAYWEAGFAEGLGYPVIYTCEASVFDKPKGVHFDTNHHLTVKWSADSIAKAVIDLKATVRATLPNEALFDNT